MAARGYVVYTQEYRCAHNPVVGPTISKCSALSMAGGKVSSINQGLCVSLQEGGQCRANGFEPTLPQEMKFRSTMGYKTVSAEEEEVIQSVLATKCPICRGNGRVDRSFMIMGSGRVCPGCKGGETRAAYDEVQARIKS